MPINLEFVKQFATFGSILAGFSIAIAFDLIGKTDNNTQDKKQKCFLISLTASFFLVTSVILILAVFLSSLLISVHEITPDKPQLLWGADILFYLVVCGTTSMLAGIGISGFIKSAKLGIFTAAISAVCFLSAIGFFIKIAL